MEAFEQKFVEQEEPIEETAWLRNVTQVFKQTKQLEPERQRNQVLAGQVVVCVLLFGAVLLCQYAFPEQEALLQRQYQAWFEQADYTPSIVRFTQQVAEVFSVEVSAEEGMYSTTQASLNSSDNANSTVDTQQTTAQGNTNAIAPEAQNDSFPKEKPTTPPSGASEADFTTDLPHTLPVQYDWMSSGYGWRADPFSGEWAFHNAVDLACAEGTEVVAAMAGVIECNRASESYGNYLRIRHADGSVTVYAHLQYAFARVGQIVMMGEVIGTAGQTGWATGPHLHFETRIDFVTTNPSNCFEIAG